MLSALPIQVQLLLPGVHRKGSDCYADWRVVVWGVPGYDWRAAAVKWLWCVTKLEKVALTHGLRQLVDIVTFVKISVLDTLPPLDGIPCMS